MGINKLGEVVASGSGNNSMEVMISAATNTGGVIVRTASAYHNAAGAGRALLHVTVGATNYTIRCRTTPAVHLDEPIILPPGVELRAYVANSFEWRVTFGHVK